jgi:diaminopimelate epimerase
MRSSRWHAHGNEYLLVEPDRPLTADEARSLAGGGDGVLEVVAREGDTAEIVVWNPDGSVAEMSGNGTRIAARWLAEESGLRKVRIRVGPREVRARVLDDGLIEQEMGEVRVLPVERRAGYEVRPVDVGNPHAVVLGDPASLPEVGPLLEHSVPGRTNVQVARVEGRGEVTARVWERGVGETSASGTSAVAVAAATHPADSEVIVHFPGGDLVVKLRGGRALLRGPAERLPDRPPERSPGLSSCPNLHTSGTDS